MISAKTIKKTALAPTVLITHGGGMLCSSLAETLLVKNCRVVVLSNLKEHKDERLQDLLKNPRFALFDCDINQSLPEQIISVDYVFHLSTYEGLLAQGDKIDLESLLVSSVGTKNLLDLAKSSKAKFALVRPVVSVLRKSAENVGVNDSYKYAWAIAKEYMERWAVDVKVVDVGYIYGPGMSLTETMGLGSLLKNVLSGEDIKLTGDGGRKEYFTYISDAVSGLVKALFSVEDTGTLYSLASGRPQTLLEAAFILRSLANGKINIIFNETEEPYFLPKIDDGVLPQFWQLKVEFRDGLIRTLKSFGYEPNQKPFKAGLLIDNYSSQKSDGLATFSSTSLQNSTSGFRAARLPIYKLAFYKLEKLVRKILGKPSTKQNIKLAGLGFVGVMIIFTVFIGVPLLQSYVYARSALNDLNGYQKALSELNSSEAERLSENSYNHLTKLQKAFSRTRLLFKFAGKDEEFLSILNLVESTRSFSSALYSMSLGMQPFSGMWGEKGTYGASVDDFKLSSRMFKEAKDKFSFAEAYAQKVDEDRIPQSVRNDFNKYQDFLRLASKTSEVMVQASSDIPELLGMSKEKTYLFLFQNNNELRPTGGFIGSYALVKVKDGAISDIKIDDIYNPDGQLSLNGSNKDYLSPKPIADFLEEDVLYLRNANWDPSFPQSSQTISKLLNLSGISNIDGVVAMDLYLVRDLIGLTGPIYLAAYDEEIRAENMYERVQYHSDFNFKEGVSTKKAFLTVLGGKMLESFFSLPKERFPYLAAIFLRSLDQKHLLIHLPGSYMSKYLEDEGWSGELINTSADYLYVVNANLGGTKSNYFVKNSMNYAVTSKTSDGILRGEVELTYENTQKDSAWPGGPYKNYVRVLVQDGSKLTGAYVVGGSYDKAALPTPQSTLQIPQPSPDGVDAIGVDVMKDVVISRVGRYVSFEYPIIVNPGEKVLLIISYDLPSSLSTVKGGNDYTLVWQKQPGTQNDSVRFMFTPPFGSVISDSYPSQPIQDGMYEYKGMLNEDLKISVTYR